MSCSMFFVLSDMIIPDPDGSWALEMCLAQVKNRFFSFIYIGMGVHARMCIHACVFLRVFPNVSKKVSIAVIKHHNQKQLGEERAYFSL